MMKQAEAQIKYRKDYQPSQFLITQTKLKFQLFEQYTLVTSELYFVKNSENTSETILPIQLDGVELELLEIAINDRVLNPNEYHTTEEYLEFLPTESSFTLKIQVKILPHKNTSLEGLYTSAGKFCTQCEAEGFRKITYYPDRPDIMSEFTVRIEADKKAYPLLLSNGNPTGSGELTNGRHFTEWHDPFPKPSYLFALVAGDLDCLDDTFTTCSGRNVDLKLYVDKGKLDQCEFAMQSLKAAMKWDEEKFG
ncbi:MAG: aminopeptidase N, partial [Gammaproteobacteria bacterium]|nr:aminopeptidase N [Gammaproteobacteria bacterium]